MLFSRKKRQYSVLYKDQIWSLKVGIYSIIGWKKELSKELNKQWIYIQKIIDLEKLIEKSKSIQWNDQQLFDFTNILRLELAKGLDSAVSTKDALWEVYKKTFDPVVYALLIHAKNNRKFENIIPEFSNIFDDVYIATIKWFFAVKHDPCAGLLKLEERISERQEFKRTLLDKTRILILTIGLTIILSYVLDFIIYDGIKENYAKFWKPLPDFTEFYHNSLYFFAKYFGFIFLAWGVLGMFYKLTSREKFKIALGRFKFQIPIYWDIHKKKCIYDIIEIFTVMRESDTTQRELLKILAESSNNFYLKKIIEEATEEIKWGKQIWLALEEYGFFTWPDEDVIHAFKSPRMDESMKSLKRVKLVELNQLVAKSMRSLTTAMLIASLILGASMGVAYYGPVQKQTTLVKDQINADKEASLNN